MRNQAFKLHELTIDIAAIREDDQPTHTTFFSYDRRTGKNIIYFLKEGEVLNLRTLPGLNVKFQFVYLDCGVEKILESADGSIIIENATEGQCSVILPNHLYQHWGKVIINVYLDWMINGEIYSFDAGRYITTFEESWIDRSLPRIEEVYWRRLENFIADFRAEMAEIINQTNDFKANSMREFLEWFEGAKDTLSGDVAGNLFNMIWEHERKIIFESGGVHGIDFENGRQLVYIPRVGWVHVANAFRANWAQRDAMGLTWAQRDAMALTWIELDNMKGVIR